MANEKSTVITIRVKESIKKKLELESENSSMTLSNLISKVLTRHTEWDVFAEEIGFVMSTKQFLREVLNSVPDSKVIELAKTVCKNSFREAVIFIHGEQNQQNTTKTISKWLNASGISYRVIETNANTKFIIQHNLGKKWSLYAYILFSELYGEIQKRVNKETIENDNLTFTVDK